jgi:hypothetical protein
MFSAASGGSIDKPTVMLIAHVLALLAAIAVLSFGSGVVWIRFLIATGLAVMVPLVTVIYRRRSSVMAFGVLPAILLYELFYLARVCSVAALVARAARDPK